MSAGAATHRPWATWLVLAAFALAALATGFLLVAPVVMQQSVSQSVAAVPAGTPVTTGASAEMRHLTLVESQGPQVVAMLLIPVAIAGLPLAVRWSPLLWRATRIITAVLLAGWVLITGFSVGLLYAPSALAMLAAAIQAEEA